MLLSDYRHVCGECGLETVHHKHPHESIGDRVKFWCEHCEKDVEGTIGGPI
ncbi:hypothetical protein GJ633_03015 [Halorubrum sp. CBA1125]|nr:hypothetical protein [Halorubrum sp. CBA1125]